MILRVWNPIIRNKNDSLKFEVVCRLATTNRFKDFEKKEINPFQIWLVDFLFFMANNCFNIIIYVDYFVFKL